jgi:hypothetical protein
VISAAFEKQLRDVYVWLDGKSYVERLRVLYHEEISQPRAIGRQVAELLQIDLDLDAVAQRGDASLYRNSSH